MERFGTVVLVLAALGFLGFGLAIVAAPEAVLAPVGISGTPAGLVELRAFYGGLALGMMEQFASAVLGSQWKAVTVFVVLVLILLFKPNGLFGEAVQQTRT